MANSMNGPITRCPWCSAVLPDAPVEQCPSCLATLVGTSGADAEIKGVTTLDPEAILRARSDAGRPRGGILSFITGETMPDTGGGPASPDSLAPPDVEVRREMLRLQLEAERADLTAETVALKADVLAKYGIPLSQLAAPEAVTDAEAEPAAGAAPAGGEPEAPETGEPEAEWPPEVDPDGAPAAAEPPIPG